MADKLKRYFRKEFQKHNFLLEHEDSSDFYLSCWQRNRSCWPLLVIRTLILIGCAATIVFSMIIMTSSMRFGLWFIFMTHWGLVFNTISAALALALSVWELLNGPDSSPTTLVKVYWAVFNATITMAFFITAFYWTMLTDLPEETDYAMDPVLDVFVHGINSVFMFCLLITARHPTRLLHFYFPLTLGVIYLVFTLIYYFCGGLSPFNTTWIYPMLDWAEPGMTILVTAGSAILIVVIHFIVAAMTVGRDAVTKRFQTPRLISISGQNSGQSTTYYR